MRTTVRRMTGAAGDDDRGARSCPARARLAPGLCPAWLCQQVQRTDGRTAGQYGVVECRARQAQVVGQDGAQGGAQVAGPGSGQASLPARGRLSPRRPARRPRCHCRGRCPGCRSSPPRGRTRWPCGPAPAPGRVCCGTSWPAGRPGRACIQAGSMAPRCPRPWARAAPAARRFAVPLCAAAGRPHAHPRPRRQPGRGPASRWPVRAGGCRLIQAPAGRRNANARGTAGPTHAAPQLAAGFSKCGVAWGGHGSQAVHAATQHHEDKAVGVVGRGGGVKAQRGGPAG